MMILSCSDLNYNPSLVPNSQPSSGKLTCLGSNNNNNDTSDKDKILAIVLPIIFGVTLIVVGVLVWLAKTKRKRVGYDLIQQQ